MASDNESTFCFRCRSYLRPDLAEIAYIGPGVVRCVCRDCNQQIYVEQIEQAVRMMKLPSRQTELPLLTPISG